MTETTQVLLVAVITVLTILMVVIGWQIVLILAEFKKMLSKFNLMADGAVSITGNLTKSVQNFSGFSDGIKSAFSIFKLFKRKETTEGEQYGKLRPQG